MNKSIKIITVILVVCLIVAVPLFAGKSLPDGNIIPSGEEIEQEMLEDSDSLEITLDEDLTEEAEDEMEVEEPEDMIEEISEILTDVDEVIQVGEEAEIPMEEFQDREVNVTTCSLTITCGSVLDDMDKLKDSKKGVVPQNGIIYQGENIEFMTGESAFDVIRRELEKNNIHFDFVKAPIYNSVYVKGIGNLYEFDCGDMSGWLYRVNGEKQSYGCSKYILNDKDKIEFYYSCNYLDDM